MASANITGPSVAVPTITHRSATWAFKRPGPLKGNFETTRVRRATPTPCLLSLIAMLGVIADRACVRTFVDRYLSVGACLVNLVLTVACGNTVRINRAGWQHDEEPLCSVAGFYDQSRRLCRPRGASLQQRHGRRPSRR